MHKTIAVIEQNYPLRSMLCHALRTAGYQHVLSISNVHYFLMEHNSLESLVVFCDFDGDHNGIRNFLQTIKKRSDKVPVIVTLSHPSKEDISDLISAGVSWILVKPFSAEDMCQCIKKAENSPTKSHN